MQQVFDVCDWQQMSYGDKNLMYFQSMPQHGLHRATMADYLA